jgi:hypothetical protein
VFLSHARFDYKADPSDPASVHPYVFDVSMDAVIESEPGEEHYNPKDFVVNGEVM